MLTKLGYIMKRYKKLYIKRVSSNETLMDNPNGFLSTILFVRPMVSHNLVASISERCNRFKLKNLCVKH